MLSRYIYYWKCQFMSFAMYIYYSLIYALIGLCCACGDPANLMCLGFIPSFRFSCFLLNKHSPKILPQILFLELIAAIVSAGFLLSEISINSVFSVVLIKTFVSTLAALYCFYTISFFNLKMTFELEPGLKADAKQFPELKNLWSNQKFIALTS